MSTADTDPPAPRTLPIIVHVLDRFDIGGMETVALELIGRTRTRYRHHVICLRDKGALAARLDAIGVPVESMGKRPGKDFGAYLRLWRCLRRLAPDIVHTYNIGAIDAALPARAAGVRAVIHAEHGRDAGDPGGTNVKYRWLRRVLAPAITRFVAVSSDLAGWLVRDVGIVERKVVTLHNGIDTERFHPRPEADDHAHGESLRIGTCGRLDRVKDFATLIEAFALLVVAEPARDLQLVIVGEGPERAALEQRIEALDLGARVTLTGARPDVDEILRTLDIYVCSSIAEGVALTVLEAMASGLPVVATAVGGNPELVRDGETGLLVPPNEPSAIAAALGRLCNAQQQSRMMGRAGRARALSEFGQQRVTQAYCRLYDACLGARRRPVFRSD